ncbi:rubrerythrin family protein [Clostridium tagluense]|uniref:rubrerythrin n=1 Tax=Clostridium tagluense TaxID=360422 RepID=UPI001C0C7BC6|nr:rubrerythrin family protein [Clostridium tagluense]MBU3127011.1 rubrerythrin family protein [Clostridium tagluense]MCB2311013.1 rubrerythrin family protein [Clostridium tagluense]MCB2316871.1 rubrerythrin family protein [Clostridium tagluense]MCB2321747.1 rubrerythrin family protein [Clostridium tagluense]MCB2325661.1 rubrerythrin family protein [Clostridium tagluense]
MQLNDSKTEKNLLKTFAGESRARNKYTFYAEKAEKEGYEYVASIFEATANNEKAHAREVFNRFLKMNKSTAENLMDAAKGESFESNKLYKQFEKEAREEGFMEIADFYKELQEVEESHEMRYMKIYENLVSGMMFKRNNEVKWQCMNCGYIHIGKEAPLFCPLCKFPRAYFKIYCEDYK